MSKSKLFALMACVALVSGVAWAAAETLSINLPAEPAGIDAVLVPGAVGGEIVLTEYWTDEIELRIGFDPSGTLAVDGVAAGSIDLDHQHSVHVDVTEGSAGFVATVKVTDDVTGEVICSGVGVTLGVDAPAKATASGAKVLCLCAE